MRPELDQERLPLRLAMARLVIEARAGAQRAFQAPRLAPYSGHLGGSPLEAGVQDREEESILAFEVVVDGALCVAGLRGDLVERGAVIAAAEEYLAGGLKNLPPCLRLALRSSETGCHRCLSTYHW